MTYPTCNRCASKFICCEYKGAFKPPESNVAESALEFNKSVPSLLSISDQTMMLDSAPSFFRDVQLDHIDDFFFQAFDNRVNQHLNDAETLGNVYPTVGSMDRERIRYIIRKLVGYPEKLLRYGKTAFVHPQAYQMVMSPALQDACCAAALYSGKNEINEVMIWEIISTKANHLVEPRASWSISEHLAHLQALIVFQIIRLFDGDIRQRAEAERHQHILTQWTQQLSDRTGATMHNGRAVPSSWESWVFEEIVRRTLLVSSMVQSMFSIQKQGWCMLVDVVQDMSFTAQRSLWDAPTGQHWQIVLAEKSRFYVHRMDLEEVLSSATPDDMDDLGLLMLVTYKGIEGVNEWIMRAGGTALIE